MDADRDGLTLEFYRTQAEAYTSRGQTPNRRYLDMFMSKLPPGAGTLELGCGAGQDGEVMLDHGFDVMLTDGTPEIARAAQNRLGRPVETLLFEDLDAIEAFHGIWANACLLHIPRPALPQIVSNIHRALKPGGAFYSSFKAGSEEGRDRFGRYYNYPSESWLADIFGAVGWNEISISTADGSGYDHLPTRWLHVMATKPL